MDWESARKVNCKEITICIAFSQCIMYQENYYQGDAHIIVHIIT